MKVKTKYISILSTCIVFLFFFGFCKESKLRNTPTSGEITIAADETFKPILDAEIAVFQSLYQYAKINVIYKSETEALNDLLKDSVHLIITSRPLKNAETDFFHSKKYYPKELKIAIDGIALITSRENPDSIISLPNFARILRGEITSWKQLNPNSKLDKISVVFDNKNSSTIRFMLDSVLRDTTLSNNHLALEHNEDVIDYVSGKKDMIGVIGVSWISDRDDTTMMSFLKNIRIMAVSFDSIATWSNSYQPYQGYIAKGVYPLSRNIYVINSEPWKGLATGFASFLASERGQRIILKSGILPATQPFRIIEVKEY